MDNYEDTPYPIETPAGRNPPDGAIVDYFLRSAATSELTMTISDEDGAEVAAFSSAPKPIELPPPNVPEYWFAPPTALTKLVGVNRLVWDLRYPAPPTLPYGYFGEPLGYTEYTLADHAVPGLTPRQQPRGPLVVPGKYTVELRAGGETLRQQLTIELDPRVHASQADLIEQRDLALEISRGMKSSTDSYHQVIALRDALADRQKSSSPSELKKIKEPVAALEKKIGDLLKGPKAAPGFGVVNRDLTRLIFSVESADMRPTDTVRTAVRQNCDALNKDLAKWQQLNQQDVASLNARLLKSNLAALPVATGNLSGCK